MRNRLVLASLLGLLATPASAQGLMSGTGLQPSTQLATPPGTPAIDRPGAEQKALAQRSAANRTSARRATRHGSAPAAAATTNSVPR